ncbi:MAG: DUF1934 domain-containing protein [Lachnospiraceae bacterium]|nr:DUF1934 domain-containing protein [Lachnospiraceae bacterium]
MTKRVHITVTGTQWNDDCEPEVIKTEHDGILVKQREKAYLKYDEVLEGTDSVTANLVKIELNEVTVVKKGAVNAEMHFVADKRKSAGYDTGHGTLRMGIYTNNIAVFENDCEYRLLIDYRLEMNGEFFANSRIDITAHLLV